MMGQDEVDRINSISEKIIGCAFAVANTLGTGFLEKVYENALAHELRKAGLRVQQQETIRVFYDGVEVGYYVADLLVEDLVLVEIKVAKALDDIHLAQGMNYLRATGLKLCLLVNFGTPKVGIKRIVNRLGLSQPNTQSVFIRVHLRSSAVPFGEWHKKGIHGEEINTGEGREYGGAHASR